MNQEIKSLLNDFEKAGIASNEVISAMSKHSLPEDYLSMLSEMNGGEGFIGDIYIILWKLEELEEFNKDYETNTYAPGILLFGSDGGGEGFGFDMRTPYCQVVQIPFVGMSLENVVPVADNFTELLKRMGVADGSLL